VNCHFALAIFEVAYLILELFIDEFDQKTSTAPQLKF